MMILQDKSFGERPEIRDKKTEMAKLEENVNFQMYFKDYWNIRWEERIDFESPDTFIVLPIFVKKLELTVYLKQIKLAHSF